MSLDVFKQEVREHYLTRHFDKAAIDSLLSSIDSSLIDNRLVFVGANLECEIQHLISKFKKIDHSPLPDDRIKEKRPSAIFGFSFGYRLKSRPAAGIASRLPGKNNRSLADVIARLKSALENVPVCVQFEIADALADKHGIKPDFVAPAEDMGTEKALDYFIKHLHWKTFAQGRNTVVVAAHRNHLGRCLLYLEDKHLNGLVPRKLPESYDCQEAQDRVQSPEDCIHSDFVSMVARIKEQDR